MQLLQKLSGLLFTEPPVQWRSQEFDLGVHSSPPLPLEVGPLNPARGFGGAL